MDKKKKPSGEKLFLDMPFQEAVGRFANVAPEEMHGNIDRAKKKKPPGGKKKPPGGKVDASKVVSLRDVRIRKRNYGR